MTIKPADKHLGTVLFDTDDYIDLCLQQLARIGPYQQGRVLHAHTVQVLHVFFKVSWPTWSLILPKLLLSLGA